MIEKLRNALFSQNLTILTQSNPFINRDTTINLPTVILVVFGILFMLLGISLFFYYPKQKNKMNLYKKEQLEEYRKNNPKKKHIPYESTGLYVPSWERMKNSMPLILGIAFFFIGLFFILGRTAF